MPAALYNARTTPSSLHGTTLASKLARSVHLLTLELTQLSINSPAPTNSQLDHFTLGSPSNTARVMLAALYNTTAKTFTFQCAVVNTRAPHPLHCSQLPSQLFVTLSPFQRQGERHWASTSTSF